MSLARGTNRSRDEFGSNRSHRSRRRLALASFFVRSSDRRKMKNRWRQDPRAFEDIPGISGNLGAVELCWLRILPSLCWDRRFQQLGGTASVESSGSRHLKEKFELKECYVVNSRRMF